MVRKLAIATVVISVALVSLFLLPAPDFVSGTFLVTTLMVLAALWVKGIPKRPILDPRAIGLGVASALALYVVFYAGNAAIAVTGIPGLRPSNEGSIYSLISNPSNPLSLQVFLLAFDAVGYESFFRGTLMSAVRPRLGLASAPMIALADAALHLATFNLLWVATTFVADLVWGLTYYFGKGTQASMTSHFLWDLAIFIIRPIS